MKNMYGPYNLWRYNVIFLSNELIYFESILIDYLGWGRESLCFCYRLLVVSVRRSFLFLLVGSWDRLCYFIVTLPVPSI